MNQVLFAGNLLLIAFVSYFGAKLHRPRIIALGCTILSLGCLLISVPHFLFGRWVFCLAHSSFCDPYLHESIHPSTECVAYWERHCWAWIQYDHCRAVSFVLLLRWLQKSVITAWGESPLWWAPSLAFAFILLHPLVWAFPRNSGLWHCQFTLPALICLDGQWKVIFKDLLVWNLDDRSPGHCVGKACTNHSDLSTTSKWFLLGLKK